MNTTVIEHRAPRGLITQFGFVGRIADVALVLIGAAIAYPLRFGGDDVPWGELAGVLCAFDAVLCALLFPVFDIYASWRGRALSGLIVRMTVAWTTVFTLGLAFLFVTHRSVELSRLWCAGWFLISLGLMIGGKLIGYRILQWLRGRGLNLRHIAVVGHNAYAVELVEHLRNTMHAGFVPVCVFAERHTPEVARLNLPMVTSLSELANEVRARRVHEIWITLPPRREAMIRQLLATFRHDFVNIRLLPDIHAFGLIGNPVTELVGVPAINLLASPAGDQYFVLKEVFDRVFAGAVLAAIAPLMMVIALAVKLSSPGPVFFRQWRKGIDGRTFQIYKFRTMVVHEEAAGQLTQAVQGDRRITKVGMFLRRTSLDELPQFINVMRGEMSVVGPRPHAIQHDEQYKELVEGYMLRYRIKPGITGWAQVNGYRGETAQIERMQGRVKFDLYYMQHWSFWLDVRIVWMTLFKGIAGSNAY
ncbi:lipopolysaccharide biosynthesis-like protein [Pandoraea terrae]|uniref:Lipopolysaccharide biosynthesis-like protein n=1 Tax=Pandoraea terrae TaxID=1537710 RepID=A0A5E4URP0_9BURK|nr:undecaprenyl-phosphate glucose phosphotransferase [Pandoraea terrae]VVE02648.1 lipopolysaccharide biosynthesis-like protein [Pandoraea terrae]